MVISITELGSGTTGNWKSVPALNVPVNVENATASSLPSIARFKNREKKP